ncbi:hypothetical protein P8452_13668 [Trifolium repens]|nr:hypothetical protein P8452_13668 [Trifolium repens]
MKQYIRSRIGKEEEFRAGERTVFAYGVTSSGKTHSMHFSSLGSLDEKWMVELASSMSAGLSEDRVPLGMGEPQIIWPTVEDVRCSIEGYAAGSAIPSPLKNVENMFDSTSKFAVMEMVNSRRRRCESRVSEFLFRGSER